MYKINYVISNQSTDVVINLLYCLSTYEIVASLGGPICIIKFKIAFILFRFLTKVS